MLDLNADCVCDTLWLALLDVPAESGKIFKAFCYAMRDSRKLDGSVFALSLSFSLSLFLQLQSLFIGFFLAFSIFIADVGRRSRSGEATFRSVLMPFTIHFPRWGAATASFLIALVHC